MKKLSAEQKHILRLIGKEEEEGWAPVSEVLFPILAGNTPKELAEFEILDGRRRARLTEKGKWVVYAMDWL